MFMDTQKERDIGLGDKYKEEPMDQGQCIISKQMSENLQAYEGQIIFNRFDVTQNLYALVDLFNKEYALKKQVP
jgi:hypothetical protein